ncbi:MAG: hypothetical protein U5N58_10975 [Actinomycetota bacterium]|nr:hypothetical protein [Actinomycetota bacterium]
MQQGGQQKIIVKEASKIIDNHGTIEIYSLFDEPVKQKECYVKEIDLEKNYIVLVGKEER